MTSQEVIHERIEEARLLLETLGMDAERSNERSALVFLALLQLKPGAGWAIASNPMLGTRAIMDFIRDFYEKDYAANSRETIRRYTLHQFVDCQLVVQNPDAPNRPVNSPKWNYQITDHALDLIKKYGELQWVTSLAKYLDEVPKLKQLYSAEREMNRIPVALSDGTALTLSPGGQNILLKAMIDDFCPLFTPKGEVLYIGDADSKWAYFDSKKLDSLGVKVNSHGKMPDLIVYLRKRNWLILMEAASSHGPVDAKRQRELAELFVGSTAGLVYVSCFPDRAEYRKYVEKIAWESEVWCADNPTHLIQYDGSRFLGPYS